MNIYSKIDKLAYFGRCNFANKLGLFYLKWNFTMSQFLKKNLPTVNHCIIYTIKDVTYLNIILSKSKGYSMIPVVGTLTRKMSCSVGKQSPCAIRSILSRQLKIIKSKYYLQTPHRKNCCYCQTFGLWVKCYFLLFFQANDPDKSPKTFIKYQKI